SALPTWAQVLPLPLGLLAADHIVTVSPHYAQEILTPEFGAGLEDFLASRAGSISGILNGIDTARWDPAADPHLAASFDRENIHLRWTNKTSLQHEFNLPVDPAVPLIGVVSRLDYQKGIDLLPDAFRTIRDHDGQLIVLGTGDPALERALNQLETQFPHRARAAIRFDSALSSRIFASADLTLIPSRYEPCGLTQMIAMRYGCVPLARATGGLVDTIQDRLGDHTNTGFLFKDAASPALARTLERALMVYTDQDSWRELQRNGMRQDFSWHTSASQYLQRYNIMTSTRK
ncbi:MAG: glycogen/starch synthase, partial [Chloroflexota bacterium]|nr:glycogen/starch synthase [Chloroflexota bacterium]